MCCDFLRDIDNEKYINIVTGFNASCGSEISDSYDLPWILSRAGISLKDL